MEALLQQSRSLCPFLQRTSPATLRSLSTSTGTAGSSPGGGTLSNLQVIARRCPVMSKALAVQSSRSSLAAGFSTVAAGAAGARARAGKAGFGTGTASATAAAVRGGKRGLHGSSAAKASVGGVGEDVYGKRERGG